MREIISSNFPTYSLICADNGYLGLDLIKEKIPRLIIINHDLPLMNGLQLIQEIRKNERNFAIPIIVLAELISDELIAHYKTAGIICVIKDLFNYTELINKLNETLINELSAN